MEETKNARALLGYMDEQEALSFLKGSCLFSDPSEDHLTRLWQSAKSAVDKMRVHELGCEVLDIDERYKSHLESVSKDAVFPEAVGKSKWSFKLVELDNLVCFQKYVDTDYAGLIGEGRNLAEMETLLEFCLPLKPKPRKVGVSPDPTQNAHTLFSSTLDFRVVGTFLSQDPATKRRMFGFATGFGIPYTQVAHFRDRYVLKNGYHRAYMIRKAGLRRMPCILVEAENLADTGSARPGFFQEPLLMSRSPPTISDFFDDAIAPPLKMSPLTKVIRIRAEEFALPGVAQALSGAPTEATNALVKMAPSVGLASAETLKGEREGWSVYRLEDGTILKVSQLLMDIGGTKLEPDSIAQEVTMQLSNVFMALSIAPNLRGTPSKQQYSPAELAAAVVKKNLKFERISETVNSYITTTGDRLGLNLALMDVSRTNKYDASGNPIYLVNTQVSIQQLVRDSA